MRLIDADKFILALMDASLSSVDEDTILDLVDSVPIVDVAPVVHGRWIKDDFLSDDVNNAEKCSQCGELIGWFGNLPNYCPNCGAKMDGGDSDETD